jgi:hypothetical protein
MRAKAAFSTPAAAAWSNEVGERVNKVDALTELRRHRVVECPEEGLAVVAVRVMGQMCLE